ncbi:MAG: AAA family ATPase [Firmicutes bacterium]|nr:AAA family ATPase [Bacillota bacterium]
MRIERLRLRHVAGVRAREVTFGPGVTIVEGPNESGKSTLLMALRHLLATQDGSQAKEIRALRSQRWPEHGPEVEAEILLGPVRAVYRKRWLVRPETSLLLEHDGGRTERLGAGEAHDRMRELFEAHVDPALWEALQVMQGEGWTPVKPGRLPGLMRLLEGAEGGADGDEGTTLLARARAEAAQYWTEREWRPRGPLRQAMDAHAQAQRTCRQLGDERRQVEEWADRLVRDEADLRRQQETLAKAVEGARRAEEQEGRVGEAQAALARAQEALARAEGDYRLAEAELMKRRALAKDAEDAAKRAEEADGEAQAAARAAEEAEASRAEAERAYEEARRKSARAREELRAAEDDLALVRARSEVEGWTRRLERVRTLGEALARAEGELGRLAAVPELLARAEEVQAELTRIDARLDAQAPRLELEAAAPLALEVEGEAIRLLPGQAWARRVVERLEVRHGDLRARLVPGVDAAQEGRERRRLTEELADLLRRAGADSVAALRALAERRSQAEADARRLRAERAEALEGVSAAELEARLAGARARAEALEAARPADRPPPHGLEAAEAARRTAAEAAETARQEEERRLEALRRQEAGVQEAAMARERASARRQEAEEHRSVLRARLEEERRRQEDADLERQAAAAADALAAAKGEERRAAAALEALDPESAAMRLRNARALVESARREGERLRADIERLRGALEARGGDGLDERLAEAEATLERAAAELRRTEVRAKAARRLVELLAQERAEALARYREPYRRALDRYARAVFGPDTRVELDDDMAVRELVEEGVAIPFERLSTGAQEQLAVLARAACARLAAADGEGVPLVLDDAFGYSDPDRLERLGSVLRDVADGGQVILLTCVPDRYRWVSGATFVRVERDRGGGDGEGEEEARALAAEPPVPLVSTPPPAPGTGEGTWRAAVLRCLKEAGRPLGKGEILERTGVPEGEWMRTIRALLEAQVVVQSGTRRGARYALPAWSARASSDAP